MQFPIQLVKAHRAFMGKPPFCVSRNCKDEMAFRHFISTDMHIHDPACLVTFCYYPISTFSLFGQRTTKIFNSLDTVIDFLTYEDPPIQPVFSISAVCPKSLTCHTIDVAPGENMEDVYNARTR